MSEETEQEKQDREDTEFINSENGRKVPAKKGSLNLGVNQRENKTEYTRRYRQHLKQNEPEKYLEQQRRDKENRPPDYFKKWREKKLLENPEMDREAALKRYGISIEGKLKMAELQGYRCLVCGDRFDLDKLMIDHDHFNKKVRGLLCQNCNSAIGFLKDDPNKARSLARYLDDWYTKNY